MIETYDSEFVQNFLSGQASEMKPMVNLMAQVFAILVVGIILWRISSVFSKRKKTRRKNMFSESSYQAHWKNK
jgi:hypothetical protein